MGLDLDLDLDLTFSQSAITMTEGSVMVLSSSFVALFFSSL